jgi:hypothetical protein
LVHQVRQRTDLIQHQAWDALHQEWNLMENWLGLRSTQ